jgi:hypothetical protein
LALRRRFRAVAVEGTSFTSFTKVSCHKPRSPYNLGLRAVPGFFAPPDLSHICRGPRPR